MRLQVEMPIVRKEQGREQRQGVSEPLARMPVRLRSESFYPVQRFLRDSFVRSFVRYHRVQRAGKEKRNKVEMSEEGTRWETATGEDVEEEGERRAEPVLSEARASHDIRPARSYEVVQLANQSTIFRGDRSARWRGTSNTIRRRDSLARNRD